MPWPPKAGKRRRLRRSPIEYEVERRELIRELRLRLHTKQAYDKLMRKIRRR